MDRLSIIADSIEQAQDVGRQLAGIFVAQPLARIGFSHEKPAKYTLVDLNLADSARLPELRLWLERRPPHGKAIFVIEPCDRRQVIQAYAIGATDVLNRPIDRRMLLTTLLGDFGASVAEPSGVSIAASNGVGAGIGALQAIFASALSGTPVDLKMVHAAGETVVSHIEAEGLARWVEVVRQHHSLTYQHCLLVTGIAVAFGQHLSFSSVDKQKLALAGLFHDIGKACIPITVLEKPGPLEGDEVAVMRQHPLLGFETLREVRGLDPDLLDIVVHHHEYLDGSGYPHALEANELSDLVRIMTISDVFGALVERRSYKAPLSPEAAYQIVKNMGRKLDADLVREFQPFALARIVYAHAEC